jgi:hypothetical protein
VSIVIDDGNGARMADNERRRLDRLRIVGQPVGAMRLFSTVSVMKAAGIRRFLTDKAEMRKAYAQLRACDDGLPDISQTDLLSAEIWR